MSADSHLFSRSHERRLASAGRAGAWTRGNNAGLRQQFLRRNWRRLLVLIAAPAALTAVLLLLVRPAFERGLIVGGVAVGTLAGIGVMVVLATGTASTSMGAMAEQWTVSELRPLRKAGWRLANHFLLRKWDIDHVLVGPGGVYAVETKWSESGWPAGRSDRRLLDAVEQARRNAHDLEFWAPLRKCGIGAVTPVVFIWGADRAATAGGKPAGVVRINGVDVVYGEDAARQWRSRVNHPALGHSIDAPTRTTAWAAILDQAALRDALETRPATLTQLSGVSAAGLCAGLGAIFVALMLGTVVSAETLWAAIVLALGAASLLARRMVPLRVAATAMATGFFGTGALVLALIAAVR